MKLKKTITAAAIAMAATTSADAAVVTFAGTNYADALISTTGSAVSAFNFGNTTTVVNAVTTVNGVNFDRYEFTDGVVNGFDHVGANGTGDGGAGTNTTLTLGGIFGGTGELAYTNLTVGRQYEVQMVFSDTRAFLTTNTMSIWDTSTVIGGADFTTPYIMTAQLVTGTFTADAATQGFYLRENTNFGAFDGYIGAIQLRDVTVPEPSAALLGGLGMLALLRRRRA